MREVSLVGRREIPSREAMAPFWNPLRGESNPALASVPFYRGRNSYAVATGKDEEEDHLGANDRKLQDGPFLKRGLCVTLLEGLLAHL